MQLRLDERERRAEVRAGLGVLALLSREPGSPGAYDADLCLRSLGTGETVASGAPGMQ